jgi:gluconolactonase
MLQDGQHVYFITPDRKTITSAATDLRQPNGIIDTPDGKTLYAAVSVLPLPHRGCETFS